jgi:hypothetical protein
LKSSQNDGKLIPIPTKIILSLLKLNQLIRKLQMKFGSRKVSHISGNFEMLGYVSCIKNTFGQWTIFLNP